MTAMTYLTVISMNKLLRKNSLRFEFEASYLTLIRRHQVKINTKYLIICIWVLFNSMHILLIFNAHLDRLGKNVFFFIVNFCFKFLFQFQFKTESTIR